VRPYRTLDRTDFSGKRATGPGRRRLIPGDSRRVVLSRARPDGRPCIAPMWVGSVTRRTAFRASPRISCWR